jgi:hypothetical protein
MPASASASESPSARRTRAATSSCAGACLHVEIAREHAGRAGRAENREQGKCTTLDARARGDRVLVSSPRRRSLRVNNDLVYVV